MFQYMHNTTSFIRKTLCRHSRHSSFLTFFLRKQQNYIRCVFYLFLLDSWRRGEAANFWLPDRLNNKPMDLVKNQFIAVWCATGKKISSIFFNTFFDHKNENVPTYNWSSHISSHIVIKVFGVSAPDFTNASIHDINTIYYYIPVSPYRRIQKSFIGIGHKKLLLSEHKINFIYSSQIFYKNKYQ